jgi:hypothetical protein
MSSMMASTAAKLAWSRRFRDWFFIGDWTMSVNGEPTQYAAAVLLFKRRVPGTMA